MLARATDRMLVNMQPTVACIGFPRFVVRPRTPDGNAIKTDQQIVITVPDLCKAGFHIGYVSDIPLSCRMAYAVAW